MSERTQISDEARIIGFLRYSTVSHKNLRNWRDTRRRTFADACAVVFDDGRMAARSALFKAIALPSLIEQWRSCPSFELAIMISPLLPARWRDDLNAAVAGLPFVRIVEVPVDLDIKRASRLFAFGNLPDRIRVVTTLRIDDDDCLHSGYIRKISDVSRIENVGKVYSFSKGAYFGHGKDGKIFILPRNHLRNAQGIAYIADVASKHTILTLGGHNKLDQKAEFIVDRRPYSWMRSIHGAADTRRLQKEVNLSEVLPLSDHSAMLSGNFPFLDLKSVRRALDIANAYSGPESEYSLVVQYSDDQGQA